MATYNLMYRVPFKSLSETDFEVLIEGLDYNGAVMELVGGSRPFTHYLTDEDVLTPIRSGGGTLSVYGSDYLRDLYTSNPQGVRVRVMKGSKVVWLGFMTPDTFSQDFSKPEFIYEIECVCALSTLKYKEFSSNATTVRFIDLIKEAARLAGYTKLYLTKSVSRPDGSNIYEASYLPAGNFFDELGKAMNYYEILEEIAKYLVLSTFVPYEDALYLLDYKYIMDGFNDYYLYDLAAGTTKSVALSDVTTSQQLGYRGTGATLSRIAGKNKATVRCSLYEVDNLVPPFDNDYTEFSYMLSLDKELQIDKRTTETHRGYIRHYKQPKFTFYRYHGTAGVLVEQTSEALPEIPATGNWIVGSGFVRRAVENLSQPAPSLSWENEVTFRNVDNEVPINRALAGGVNVITLKSAKPLMFNTNVHFCINFGVQFILSALTSTRQSNDFVVQPTNPLAKDVTLRMPFRLKIGRYIYTDNGWVLRTPTTETGYANPTKVLKKGSMLSGVYHMIENTNSYDTGLGDLNGFLIPPLPVNEVGEVSLDILLPFASPDVLSFAYVAFFKDIRLDYGIVNPDRIYDDWLVGGKKNDVIYENEISDDYIEEAEPVTLKICTNQEHKLALSSVLVNGQYQKEIKYEPFRVTDIAENLILMKIIDIYSRPRFKVNPTLYNGLKPYTIIHDLGLPKVVFVSAGGEEDVKMENVVTNLIEL